MVGIGGWRRRLHVVSDLSVAVGVEVVLAGTESKKSHSKVSDSEQGWSIGRRLRHQRNLLWFVAVFCFQKAFEVRRREMRGHEICSGFAVY